MVLLFFLLGYHLPASSDTSKQCRQTPPRPAGAAGAARHNCRRKRRTSRTGRRERCGPAQDYRRGALKVSPKGCEGSGDETAQERAPQNGASIGRASEGTCHARFEGPLVLLKAQVYRARRVADLVSPPYSSALSQILVISFAACLYWRSSLLRRFKYWMHAQSRESRTSSSASWREEAKLLLKGAQTIISKIKEQKMAVRGRIRQRRPCKNRPL